MPDSPVLLRTSERKDFRTCEWLWWEHWVGGVSPRRNPTWSVFGTAWHLAMEYVYQPGIRRGRGDYLDACDLFIESLDDAGRKVGVDDWEEIENEEIEQSTTKIIPARELGPKMLLNYWDKYGPEREWKIIHTEQPFQINVPMPNGPRGSVLVVYAGTWDLLAWHERERRYWLWDHKSCKQFPDLRMLDLDDQAGSYLWVAKKVLLHKGLLERKDKISGIIFNYAKKHPGDDRPRNARGEALNQNGTVSKRLATEIFLRYPAIRTPETQVKQAKRVQNEAMRMRMIRNGELSVIKNPNKDCGRCVLFDLCDAHENGDDWEYLRDTMYVRRDMYADHRVDMERSGIEL